MKATKNRKNLKYYISRVINTSSYIFLILTYGIFLLFGYLGKKISFFKKTEAGILRLMEKLDNSPKESISKTELIRLAIQNMKSKKNRTLVTVGGMTIGIATIVLLISIAYGLQSLVTNRVARLEEMKQTDVSVQPGSNLFLTDDVIKSLTNIDNIELVLPQISVVGKVNFKNSSSDMAVYGVTKEYLQQSAISPTIGKSFESNELEKTFELETSVADIETDNDDDNLEEGWVEVTSESDTGEILKVWKVKFPENMEGKEAVVNKSFLKILDLNESEAIGKTFEVSFIATNKSLLIEQDRVESEPTEYTIIGVTPDDTTPLIYVPFIHLKSLGITNYSQVKIVVDKENNLAEVRRTIDSKGFQTSSVVDTVAQIDSLFGTVRIVLALLSAVALFVASLGMFNTLTVSLLERTREIGLLKAMGMRSHEIRDLFLAESMIMGTSGGVFGILGGLFIAKVIEFGLSMYAYFNGAGTITLVDMPILFTLLIIFLSFLIGILTGYYPARRATKISALNALRYE